MRRAFMYFSFVGLSFLSELADAQTIRYIHTDALGSVVAVTDNNRNVVERREYEPYGAQLTPVVQDGPGYTGHVQDAMTGLTYMQQRYYDPSLGIFLSVDPIGSNSTVSQFNRYRYANSNPYTFHDPDGRFAWLAPFIGGGIIGAGVDIFIQKAMNPNQPINKTEVAIAFAGGAVSGGVGGVLVGAVARGTVSVGAAITVQATTNGAIGAASTVATNASQGKSTSGTELAVSIAAGAASSVASSGVAVAMGDFAGASATATLNRMASSDAPGAFNIATTTASTGTAIPAQTVLQAGSSQGAQAAVGAATSVAQPLVTDHLDDKNKK